MSGWPATLGIRGTRDRGIVELYTRLDLTPLCIVASVKSKSRRDNQAHRSILSLREEIAIALVEKGKGPRVSGCRLVSRYLLASHPRSQDSCRCRFLRSKDSMLLGESLECRLSGMITSVSPYAWRDSNHKGGNMTGPTLREPGGGNFWAGTAALSRTRANTKPCRLGQIGHGRLEMMGGMSRNAAHGKRKICEMAWKYLRPYPSGYCQIARLEED